MLIKRGLQTDKLQLSPSSPAAHAETVPRRQRPRLSGPGLTIPRLFLGPAWAGGELCLGWRMRDGVGLADKQRRHKSTSALDLSHKPQAQVMTQDKDGFLPPYPTVAQVEVRKGVCVPHAQSTSSLCLRASDIYPICQAPLGHRVITFL